jgi:FkbM family methyltransferase
MRILKKDISWKDLTPPIFIKIARKLSGKKTEPILWAPYAHPILKSYSQYSEDLVIDAFLGYKNKGFYIDVGANDPEILSNTKRFYDRGWRGINIEPNPVMYNKLVVARPDEINLNVGVGNYEGEMTFFEMSAHTLSSFDKKAALEIAKFHNAQLVKEYDVQVTRLKTIFEKYCPVNKCDFLNVDVEGLDLKVLQGNDWGKFRPTCVIIECNYFQNNPIIQFLQSNDYYLIYRNSTNVIFVDKNWKG